LSVIPSISGIADSRTTLQQCRWALPRRPLCAVRRRRHVLTTLRPGTTGTDGS